MAFRHFHRHARKYVIFATGAMMFSLFTFTIPGALRAFTGSVAGRLAGSRYITFETSSGRTVKMGQPEWSRLAVEVRGLAQIPYLSRFYMPNDPMDAPLVHAILLAEAEELGVEVPDEYCDREVQSFLSILAMLSGIQQDGIRTSQFQGYLAQFGLDMNSFRRRLKEALKIELYRSMVNPAEAGSDIPDPRLLFETFASRSEMVALEYVGFTYDQFRTQFKESPPPDEELIAFFEEKEKFPGRDEFSNPERVTLDLALLDYEALDEEDIPAAALEGFEPPDDAELLRLYRRDVSRYGVLDPAPESAADLSEEVRTRVIAEQKIKALLTVAAEEYRTAQAEIARQAEAEEEAEPEGDEEADDPADEAESGDDVEADTANTDQGERGPEREAAELEAFQGALQEYGLTYVRHEDLDQTALRDLDPPADRSLAFFTSVLKLGDVQSVEAAGERTFGYIVRMVDRKARTPKEFAEVRDLVLEEWIEQEASKAAEQAAEAFRNQVREVAESQQSAERLQGIRDHLAVKLAEVDENSRLDDEEKEQERENLKDKYFDLTGGILGVSEGPAFAQVAEEQGLDLQKIDFFRRNISTTPFFRDLHEGAERFLMSQNGGPTERVPMLLGYAPGTVSAVLRDEEGEAFYVASVAGRRVPTMEEMTPSDRVQAEREWIQERTERLRIPYQNPFSVWNLKRAHKAEVLLLTEPAAESEDEAAEEESAE